MTKYQGWKNRATWTAHLWLSNDEESSEMAKNCKTSDVLKETVEDWAEEMKLLTKGMFSDFILHSLDDVDWQEVWNAFQEE